MIDSTFFNFNKYTKWYTSIITNALSRKLLTEYTENHHIIPKSLGGEMTVRLTAREHYICHLLLPRILIEARHKEMMLYALHLLSKRTPKFNSRLYELIKKNIKRPLHTEKTKNKIAKSMTGKIKSSEVRAKIAKSMTGKTKSLETRAKISASIKKARWS